MAPIALYVSVCSIVLLVACGDDPKPDQAPPEITIDVPAAGTSVESPVTVSGTVRDAKVKGRKTSGVATVTVDGLAATLDGERFEAKVGGLGVGEHVFTVEAIDKKGNAATATVTASVDAAVIGMIVQPHVAAIESTTVPVELVVSGFYEGTGKKRLLDGVTFESADPSVATVDAAGFVRAAADVLDARTEVTVRYHALTTLVPVHVAIDVEPPARPEVLGYHAETNQRDQTWSAILEPGTLMRVDNATRGGAPIELTADAAGRVWTSVPLVANRVNEIALTLTDPRGNVSEAFDFSVLQSDGFVDGGRLHLASDDKLFGFVGEALPQPLMVRAYNTDGAPLAGAEVTFSVVTGGGRLASGCASASGCIGSSPTFADASIAKLTQRTDGDGYARAVWLLGPSDYDRVEVHASLAGDVGFPVVFRAEGFARTPGTTTLRGVVYDENRIPAVGLPVTLLAPGSEYANTTQGNTVSTDERGHFELTYAGMTEPPGAHAQHLRFDGTTMAQGSRHVRLDQVVTVLQGQDNDLGVFWMPRLPEGVAPQLDASGIVTQEIVLEREVIPGNGPVRVRVPVGTKITWPGGVPESARKLALLAIPQVRAPMSLPDGFFSPEVLALQPGGTRFEPPLPLDMPNTSRQPPGTEMTMWSYDHFQTKFLPIGRSIVSADGTRVVSAPGSGIRVGAWHQNTPNKPDEPCTAIGQTAVSKGSGEPSDKKKKKTKCKCFIEGTDTPTACPEDQDGDGKPDKFVITNIGGCKPPPPPTPPPDNKPPPPPPRKKVEVVCEDFPLEITNPEEPQLTIKTDDTVAFRARCNDGGKSNGSITWTRSAPEAKSGSGPSFTLKFAKEGKYVVTAKADTKTCKGSDSRIVEVVKCVDVGLVRICGDKITPVGPPADQRFDISGNVKMGMRASGSPPTTSSANTGASPDAGDLFLHVTGTNVIADPKTATPGGIGQLQMEVGWPIVGKKMTTVASGTWTLTGETGLMTLLQSPSKGKDDEVMLSILAVGINYTEFSFMPNGIAIKAPNALPFQASSMATIQTQECPKVVASHSMGGRTYYTPPCSAAEMQTVARQVKRPYEIKASLDGLELTRDDIRPNGSIELKKEVGIVRGLFNLTRLKIAYQKQRFIGELGWEVELKAGSMGMQTTLEIGDGFFSAGLEMTFGGEEIGPVSIPGIPIFPALIAAPLYWTKLGLKYTSSGWPVTDTDTNTFEGTIGLALGPEVNVGGRKLSLISGEIVGTFSPYPLTVGLKGTFDIMKIKGPDDFNLLNGGFGEAKLEKAGLQYTGEIKGVFDRPMSLSLTGGVTWVIPVISETEPIMSSTLSGSLTQNAETSDWYKATLTGTASAKVPKTRFNPSMEVASAGYTLSYAHPQGTLEARLEASFNVGIAALKFAILHDSVNPLPSVFVLNGHGDLVVIAGPHPNARRATMPSAPGLGVTSETPINVTYTGAPLSFELLEPTPALHITADKEPGVFAGELTLPDGRVFLPVPNPDATATGTGVDFSEGVDGLTASWVVFEAEPGTYTVKSDNSVETFRKITASIVPAPAVVTFDEPFDTEDGGVRVAWTGDGGTSNAYVQLVAIPDGGGLNIDLGTAAFGGDQAIEVATDLVKAGRYRIQAIVMDGPWTTFATTTGVYDFGYSNEDELGAPRFVRARYLDVSADGALPVEVSWLPNEGAAYYRVTLIDGDETVAHAVVNAPLNVARLIADRRARVEGTEVSAGPYERELRAVVELFDDLAVSARAEVPVALNEGLLVGSTPPLFARVGHAWRYPVRDGAREPVGCTDDRVLAGPPGLQFDGTELTWTPGETDLGPHAVDVVIACGAARQTFTIEVIGEAGVPAPESTLAPAARRIDAEIGGAELVITPSFLSLDPITVTLAQAPASATFVDGIARWTPDSESAIAGGGEVVFTFQATTEAGMVARETWVVRFADRDGDGLSDAYELASGLDPDFIDADTDPDGDGLDHGEEDALGTLGEVADSDGDGLDDGAETTTSARLADSDGDGLIDGDELTRGSDPRLVDSDGDGVGDKEEVDNETDPKVNADADGDGLPDDRELVVGSNPAAGDSDGDGLSDGEEVFGKVVSGTTCGGGTNPLIADSDGDGASDAAELAGCGTGVVTDPLRLVPDSEGDGLTGDQEALAGTSPEDFDSDDDGLSDGLELGMGTDPLSAASKVDGVESVADVPILSAGNSLELIMVPESVTDFGIIEVFPDADHDSAPDAYEDLHGYDSGSAADAYDDADGDGLPMWQEARIGTNPRAADSDGDGAADGDELREGTDPNDPASVPASGPIIALKSFPVRADVISDAIRGAATLQVAVLGTRADGSTTDLSPAARGTTYVVEPVAAGTITPDGRFTADPSFSGTAAIAVTSGALTATSTLELSLFTPGPVAMLPLGGVPSALALGEDRVFVGGPWGLRVVDTSIIAAPVLRGAVALAAPPVDLSAKGAWVAAAIGESLTIIDVSVPDSPALVATIPLGASARGVAWAETTVVVASSNGLVRVDPAIRGIGLLDVDGDGVDDRVVEVQAEGANLVDVAHDLDRIAVARADGRITTWRSVSGGLIQELDLAAGPASRGIDLRGGVLVGAIDETAGLLVLGPGATWRRSAPISGLVHVGAAPDLVLATTFGNVAFLDARGVAPLTNLGNMNVTAFNQTCFATDDRYLYIGDGNNQRLEIARHSARHDTLGIPPVVAPVTPLAGDVLLEGTRIDLEVRAEDDIGVKRVEILRDGEVVGSATSPPHRYSVKTPNVSAATTMVLGARAVDFGGNTGEMAPLAFQVTPVTDTISPTITLLEPAPSEFVAANSKVLVAARAEDEHAVWKVEFRLEGEVVATFEEPPYATEITMPSSAPGGTLALEVRAYDYGDNVASASASLIFAGIDLVTAGVTTIAADNDEYDGEDILIRGGTVAIDGPHTFGKVRIGRNGVLTHSEVTSADDAFGVELAAARVDVASTGAIDVTARGYLGDCAVGDSSCGSGPHGPGNVQVPSVPYGGGSHGGVGGLSHHPTYGDWERPTAHGMGGSFGNGGGEPGGDGGGRVRIVSDEIVLDGVIRANGGNGVGQNARNGGGGAGGSVWISAGRLDGIGRIEANGGAPASQGGAAGGGGRIALELDDAGDFALELVRALPGPVSRPRDKAGAGTVSLDVAGARSLVIDDASRSAGVDNFPLGWDLGTTPLVIGDLIVKGASRVVLVSPLEADLVRLEQDTRLSHREAENASEPGLMIEAERIEITPDAAIDLTGRGYLGDCRPGDPSCGTGSNTVGNAQGGAGMLSGGSHGGVGGGPSPNPSYGDLNAPVTLGTGGGFGNGSGEPGGDGGGRVRIIVGALVNDGAIEADGQAGIEQNAKNGSGGAGGSIWITADSLAGAGTVHANGGAHASAGGANGGGGRVAIAYDGGVWDWSKVSAWPGGGGGERGTAGTVLHRRGGEVGVLTIDDGGLGAGDGRALAFDAASTVLALDVDLVLGGTTQLVLTQPLHVETLRLEGSAVLTHLQSGSGYEGGLSVVADLVHVGAGAAIDVTGRGYLGDCAGGDPGCGSGAHSLNNDQGIGARQLGGGSHGGFGGGPAGIVYGDPFAPATLGGGGGFGNGSGEPGGDGGGRVRIVTERLELEGVIRARGSPGVDRNARNGSGGAGGSIWIDATTIAGAGAIDAGGGDRAPAAGAGGGGGRIALRYTTLTGFDLGRVTAPGGVGLDDGSGHGGPGTVWLDGADQDRLIVDNGGRVNLNEAGPWVQVGARLVKAKTADGVEVDGTPWYNDLLIGAEVVIGGTRYTISGNSGNTLVLTGASLAAIAVNDRIEGAHTLVGHLEIRGGARVSVVDAIEMEDLSLEGAAVLTHPHAPASGAEPGLALVVGNTLTIAAGAAIDVSARGFMGDCGAGDPSCGSGAHTRGFSQDGARQFAGGSHGGLGGGGSPGFVYGDAFAPVTLGGGGGFGNGSGEPGGRGGGRVRIEADTLSLDGVIRASGSPGADRNARNGSGGAGGSIWIDATTIAGAGAIDAGGGDRAPAGGAGGGGGRIALRYTTLTGFDLGRVTAPGGVGLDDGSGHGGPGTVWLDGTDQDRLIVDNGGRVNLNEAGPWVQVGALLVKAKTLDGIEVDGTPWHNDLLIGAEVVIGGTRYTISGNSGNTLVLTGASLAAIAVNDRIEGAHTLVGHLEIRGGARVSVVDAIEMEDLSLEGAAVLTHPHAPASGAEPGLALVVGNRLTIAAGAAIDVSARGFLGDCGAGDPSCGSGAHTLGFSQDGARQFAGGSHGGLGGGGSPGFVYGDAFAPVTLGGGGGFGNGSGEPGGRGGGRVRIEADTLSLDGALRADGQAGLPVVAQNGSGGAGGSVWVVAGRIDGDGEISAVGGAQAPAGGSGGGGGRIALAWDDAASGFDFDVIAAQGGPSLSAPGGPGTIWLDAPTASDRLIVDNAGLAHVNEAAPWPEIGLRSVLSASADRVEVGAGLIPDAYIGVEVLIGASATRHTVVSNTADTLVFEAADGSVAGTTGQAVRAIFVLPGVIEITGAARVALTHRLNADAMLLDAVLTHPPTLPNAEQGLWVELAGALTIGAEGRIDLTARGYRGDCQPGHPSCGSGGYWDGNSGGGARQYSGGSYGGLGGGPQPNPVYGDTLETWLLGAGGGYGIGSGAPGGAGGGRVRLIVASLVLGGAIVADGQGGTGPGAGGGAGGGILIDAASFTGAGTISARGADGFTNGGGGGGGRIHIDAPGSAGTLDVGGGISQDPSGNGDAGTSVRD